MGLFQGMIKMRKLLATLGLVGLLSDARKKIPKE